MICPNEVRGRLERVGIKNYKAAARCGIPISIFSGYLHNKEVLTQEQQIRLRKYNEIVGHFEDLLRENF